MRSRQRMASSVIATILLPLALCLSSSTARAQTGDALAGGALGAAGGGLLSLAIVTGEARAGRYLYSPEDVGWRIMMVPAGLVAGAVLGYRNPDRMWRAVGWGALGLTGGALTGAAVGAAVWDGSEGMWSGAILGSAAGLLLGSVTGARSGGEDGDGPAGVTLSFGLPVGR